MVKPIPEGYHSVTPYLILNHASDAIAFYQVAFGAQELMRMDDPSGRIHHAEISIGDSREAKSNGLAMFQGSHMAIGGDPKSATPGTKQQRFLNQAAAGELNCLSIAQAVKHAVPVGEPQILIFISRNRFDGATGP